MKLPRFVPILTSFVARVAGREMAELVQSPAALARALADTQTVIGHDGVLCLFDPPLLASACIARQERAATSDDTPDLGLRTPDQVLQSPPLANLLETIQALRHHLSERALIYAAFAGPVLLHSQLQAAPGPGGGAAGANPDYVVDVVRNVTRSALESKADGVALIEQAMPSVPSDLPRSYRMVRKLADFYDAGFLLFTLPSAQEQHAEFRAHCAFDLASAENDLGPVIGKLGPGTASATVPCTTAGDVPETTAVEELKTLMHGLRCA